MKYLSLMGLAGLIPPSFVHAACQPQDATHPPAHTRILRSNDPIFADHFANTRLLGRDGSRVIINSELPHIQLTEPPIRAEIATHWSEQLDWEAYATPNRESSLITLYRDEQGHTCRLEFRNPKLPFLKKGFGRFSGRDLKEPAQKLKLRQMLDHMSQDDAELEELQLFDYTASGQLTAASQYRPDDQQVLQLRTRRCFHYSAAGLLMGQSETEGQCPDHAPEKLSPRYLYTADGRLARQVTDVFRVDMPTDEAAQLTRHAQILLFNERGETAQLRQDNQGHLYRQPEQDLPPAGSIPSSLIVDMAISPHWKLALYDMNQPMADMRWQIQVLQARIANPFDSMADIPQAWGPPLMAGKTDAAGRINLSAAQQQQLWTAVSQTPGRIFLTYHNFHRIRLYPQLPSSLLDLCQQDTPEANQQCHLSAADK